MAASSNEQQQQPIFNAAFRSNVELEQQCHEHGVTVSIEHYKKLRGGTRSPMQMNHSEKFENYLRRIRIDLDGGMMRVERKLMHYMIGEIELIAKAPSAKKYLHAARSGESKVKPEFSGRGTIFLEPTNKYLTLLSLAPNETVVVDKSMWVASSGSVVVSSTRNKGMAGLAGGEGMYQTKLVGGSAGGMAVITHHYPHEEIDKFFLEEEQRLRVDGSFAILRRGSVKFTMTRASNSLMSSKLSGEGLLQTFTGQAGGGEVWLCPTAGYMEPIGLA
jgi:uncharacterized protein (AIM24 family)